MVEVDVCVGVALGLGDAVEVGVSVLVGSMVCVGAAVSVRLVSTVLEGVGLDVADKLQAVNIITVNIV